MLLAKPVIWLATKKMKAEKVNTSSMKITLGAILLASEKTALTYFSPSPNHWHRKELKNILNLENHIQQLRSKKNCINKSYNIPLM
jgi:hypothetical protein